MVRVNGQIMTEIRYMEIQGKVSKPTLYQKLNIYFFGCRYISKQDFLWFYGSVAVMVGVPLVTGLITGILKLLGA